MTPIEKKLFMDRLDEADRIQEAHSKRLTDQETTIAATATIVADLEERMSAFEPVLAGIDGKLNQLLDEKREKQIAEDAIKSTPFAKMVADLKKKLGETLVLLICSFVVAAIVGLFFLLLKSGAFKGLGWGS